MGRYYKPKTPVPVLVTPPDVSQFAYCAVKWKYWRSTWSMSVGQLKKTVSELEEKAALSPRESRDLKMYQVVLAQKTGKQSGVAAGSGLVVQEADPAAKFLFALGATCAAVALVALL